MPDAILDQLTQLELQNLTALASHSVYKAQELADAAEAVALQRCGPTFLASGAVPRHWVQQVVYVSFATGGIVLALGGRWVRRIGGPATQAAIDAAGGVWFRDPATGVWVASATGRTSIAVPGQAVLAVPAGETFTDPDGQRVLVPTVLWVDQTTGDTSLTGPEGGDQWAGGSNAAGRALPDGLGPLIQAPQEYVVARLLLTAGGLTAAEVAAWTAAVQSFQAPGPWEDVRQPLYALTPGGQLLVDASGLPVPNPLRTVVTPFRGEINDYYRSLVRDHGIDPFVSRTAEQFELIQVASLLALDQSVLDRFAGVQNDCVRVFRAAFYDAAYEGDPLYFRYCRLFIAWMAVMRMVDEAMTGFGDIDRMGNYDVTNLLYSFGMYTFDDMPLVYKRRFAKGMETIISNKGTTAVFKDILDIFNLGTDVTIWQHYLVRYFPSSSSHVRLPRAAAAGRSCGSPCRAAGPRRRR